MATPPADISQIVDLGATPDTITLDNADTEWSPALRPEVLREPEILPVTRYGRNNE